MPRVYSRHSLFPYCSTLEPVTQRPHRYVRRQRARSQSPSIAESKSQYGSLFRLYGRDCGRRLWRVCLRCDRRRRQRPYGHAPESVNAGQPVFIERRIHYAAMSRRVVKALFINHDPNVAQVIEEDQRSKLEFFVLWRRGKCRPVGSRGTALEDHAGVLKSTPDQSRTIKLTRTGAVEMIRRAQV